MSALSEAERAAYEELFQLADVDNDGRISVAEVAFLRKSKLTNEQLGQVWALCSEGRMFLERPQFFKALRCIVVAQKGDAMSAEAAVSVSGIPVFEGVQLKSTASAPAAAVESALDGDFTATKAEVDNFTAIFGRADEDGDGYVTGPEAKTLLGRSGLPPNILGNIWVLSDISQDGRLDQLEFSVAMWLINNCLAGNDLPSSLPESLVASLKAGGVDASAESAPVAQAAPVAAQSNQEIEGAITGADLTNYNSIFERADEDGDGFVTGNQAKLLFGRSGLEPAQLAAIWNLADRDGDQQLNRGEFAVAMHLINATLAGEPVPDKLPPALASHGLAIAAPPAVEAPVEQVAAPVEVSVPEPEPKKANYNIDLNSIGDPSSSSLLDPVMPAVASTPSSFEVASPALMPTSFSSAPAATTTTTTTTTTSTQPNGFEDSFGSSDAFGSPNAFATSSSFSPSPAPATTMALASPADIAAMRTELRQETDTNLEVEKGLLLAQKEAESANSEVRELQAQLAAKKKERESNQEKKRAYKQQLTNLSEQRTHLAQILREKEDQYKEEEELLSMLKQSVDEKQEDLERLRQQVAGVSGKLEELREKRRAVKATLQDLNEEKSALTAAQNEAAMFGGDDDATTTTNATTTTTSAAPSSGMGDLFTFGDDLPSSSEPVMQQNDEAKKEEEKKVEQKNEAAVSADPFGASSADPFAAPAATSNVDPFGASSSDPFAAPAATETKAEAPAPAALGDAFGGADAFVDSTVANFGSSDNAFGASTDPFGSSAADPFASNTPAEASGGDDDAAPSKPKKEKKEKKSKKEKEKEQPAAVTADPFGATDAFGGDTASPFGGATADAPTSFGGDAFGGDAFGGDAFGGNAFGDDATAKVDTENPFGSSGFGDDPFGANTDPFANPGDIVKTESTGSTSSSSRPSGKKSKKDKKSDKKKTTLRKSKAKKDAASGDAPPPMPKKSKKK